jgi:hypothetical protein
MRPILPTPFIANHRSPNVPVVMPIGTLPVVGTVHSSSAPSTLMRPIRFPSCSVK